MTRDPLDPSVDPNTRVSDETEAQQLKRLRLEQEYTDDELLLELRRRGRLARVEGHSVARGRDVEAGYPVEHQIEEVYMALGRMIAEDVARGRNVSSGHAVTHGRFDFLETPRRGPRDRKVRAVLNYVIEKD